MTTATTTTACYQKQIIKFYSGMFNWNFPALSFVKTENDNYNKEEYDSSSIEHCCWLPACLKHLLKRLLACIRRKKTYPEYRTVIPNHIYIKEEAKQIPNRHYANNKVKTTKYTLVTFLPKNLFEQFHRLANLYFLFIALLNWVPQVEAYGKFIGLTPILFVLSITAMKDLYEDRRRFKLDKQINHRTCKIFDGITKQYKSSVWESVTVGDIIFLSCNEVVPADILLLNSADSAGVCYIETANIDGENSLKQRVVVVPTNANGQKNKFSPNSFCNSVQCEHPNSQLYKFHGFLFNTDGTKQPLSSRNLLLRGTELRNTDFVEGIVVYAGRETKVMLNNSNTRYKQSKLERMMNSDVAACVLLLLVICFFCALGCYLWLSSFHDFSQIPFLNEFYVGPSSAVADSFVIFWTFIIVLQAMIPISLYVSLEFIKLGQIYAIGQDKQLYDSASNQAVQCRALNIPEDLGQIEYVLSDKTGTLTENLMVFKRCTIGGIDYAVEEKHSNVDNRQARSGRTLAKNIEPNVELLTTLHSLFQKPIDQNNLDHNSQTNSINLRSSECETIYNFFVNMAICNTVVVNAQSNYNTNTGKGIVIRDQSLVDQEAIEQLPLSTEPTWPAKITNTSSTKNESPPPKKKPKPINSTSVPTFLRSPISMPLFSLSDLIAAKNVNIFKKKARQQTNDIDGKDEKSTNKNLSPASAEVEDFTGTEVTLRSLDKQPPKYHSYQALKKLLDLPVFRLPPLLKPKPRSTVSCYRNPIYESESPDELALVHAAAAYGMRLARRQGTRTCVQLPNKQVDVYEILQVLAFSAKRSRMSIIARKMTTPDQLVLYTKGADCTVMNLLSEDYRNSEIGQFNIAECERHLEMYSKEGLRTLCFAMRRLSNEEYNQWLEGYSRAETVQSDVDRNEQIDFWCEQIEQNLQLLGVTAVEDRLQNNVPECIQALREAGIKVWVLTGDKMETAVNIAYASKLFTSETELITLTAKTENEAEISLQAALNRARDAENSTKQAIGLVIDGRTMNFFLKKETQKCFITLASQCTSMICCRTSPNQKGAIAKILKSVMRSQTLAIGDGANDVPMLKCADIGVGISGQEGMQAVMASDFSIPKFAMLQRLLLVHGHWCYDRLSRIVLYFFYKNAILVFLLLWYQFVCGFSAQSLVDPVYLQLYNVLFTAVPPLLFGIVERDVDAETLIKYPQLYRLGRENEVYKKKNFWINMIDAAWQSLAIFIIIFLTADQTDVNMCVIGFVSFSSLLVCSQIHLLSEVQHLTFWIIFVIIGSVVVFYGFALLYNLLSVKCCNPDPPYFVAEIIIQKPYYWETVSLIIVSALLPRLLYRLYCNAYFSTKARVRQFRVGEKKDSDTMKNQVQLCDNN
ncbi:putative phospholipid-transporting ATPase VD [Trichinella papuae]|uniref:Phospholipid-transporting ATPase n=1 Tax=Trichinella papuae TaxID=268474 RepID=A0A0V1M4Q4_9BILA|nr:putative phospholipid-transporting ATPase VD [Trichinella papuae]